MYANEDKTKEKYKLPAIKKLTTTYMKYVSLFLGWENLRNQ